jgi:type I restriction enzyme, S subunit
MIGQKLGKTGHEPNPDLPDGFQMTELGPLPKEWRVVRLGEILVETNQRVKEIEGQDIVVLSITRHFGLISQEEKFKKRVASQNLDNYKVVHRGELVYGFPMDEGVIHFLWQYPVGAVSPVYYTWKLYNSKADAHFLDYLLKTPHLLRIYEMLQSKTVHRRRIVHPKDFINISIPLPPLPEQRAIAHVLRTVQRAKEATEGVIAALKELKKSLMQHLFTYGPVPVTERERVPLQETEIGPIPAHWRVVRLGEVAEKPQYGFTAAAQRDPVGPKMLRITDIQDGNVNWNAVPYCECGNDDIPKYLLEAGDILFARTGSVGKAFLVSSVPEPSIFASYLIRVRVDRTRLDPHFAFLFMQSAAYWSQIASQTHGAVQPNVNATQLRSLLLPLPPLAEQREIARMLQAVDAKIAAEERRRAALEELFKTLLHALMSGRMRVPHIVGGERSCDSAPDADKLPKSED